MQAAVKVANSPTLKIVDDFEIPKPGPKQVLLKIQASGVCHSDVSPIHAIVVDSARGTRIAHANDVVRSSF